MNLLFVHTFSLLVYTIQVLFVHSDWLTHRLIAKHYSPLAAQEKEMASHFALVTESNILVF